MTPDARATSTLAAAPHAATAPPGVPKGLFLFSILYGGMVILAGVLGNKQVALGPLAVEAGIFAFLLLVALSSAVAELYGPRIAQRLVLWGFVPLLLSMALIALVLALPADAKMEPARLTAFETILGSTPRLMVAGIIAYGVSQFLNVTIFTRLRGAGKGSATSVAVRGGIASALSQAVDTLLFVSIAFLGVFPIATLLLGQMLAKVVLSLAVIPFVITGLVSLGRWLDREGPLA